MFSNPSDFVVAGIAVAFIGLVIAAKISSDKAEREEKERKAGSREDKIAKR